VKVQIRRPKKGFLEDRTLGSMWIDDELFCHTMEPVARPDGIKVYGKTCVPPCFASLSVTMSTRFGRLMVLANNQDNGYEVVGGGISFKGLRFHGGNEPDDTAGCPLIAFKRDGDRIWGSAEENFTRLVTKALGRGELVSCQWINCIDEL